MMRREPDFELSHAEVGIPMNLVGRKVGLTLKGRNSLFFIPHIHEPGGVS